MYNCPACGAPNEVQLTVAAVTRPASAPDADELARIEREMREVRAESDPWRERVTW